MVTVLDLDSKTFIVYIVVLDIRGTKMAVYSFQAALIGLLKAKIAPITIPMKYSDYSDVFSSKLTMKLPEYTGINDHTIELKKAKHLPYGSIYSLKLVELEMLKAYIEINLANGFIRLFKSLARVPIFLDYKFNGSFCLY